MHVLRRGGMLRRRILSPATNLFDEAGSTRFRATAQRYM
ncbi:hypothetical protein D8I24_5167 [Cupriavidus necator H850]|nr:hypothetical protein D8I24_5167 [Cupriavidus necator H850]